LEGFTVKQPSSSTLNRRQFLARSAAVAGAAAGAGLLGGSLSPSAAEAGREEGKTTLTIMSNASEVLPAYNALYQKLNSGIQINFLNYDPTRLSAMLAAGQAPDIVRVVGAQEIAYWIKRGIAADLTPYFAKSKLLTPAQLLPVCDIYRMSGTTQGIGPRYGMPKDWSPDFTVWYNQDLFDKAGVKYLDEKTPTPIDELVAIGKKLSVIKNGKVVVYGFDIGAANLWPTGFVLWALGQDGKSLFSADKTQADFTTPAARKVLKFIVDAAQAHLTVSPIDPDPSGWEGPPYIANRMAMTIFGYWFGGEVNSLSTSAGGKPVTRSAMAPSPQWGATRTNPCTTGTGHYVPAASQHKAEAFAWLEWFATGKPAMDRATGGWGVPPLKSFLPDMPHGIAAQAAAAKEVQEEMPFSGKFLQFSPYATAPSMDLIIQKYLTPAMQGHGTVDQAAAQITADVNKLLKLGKDQAG
jgi:multiple sugar transport system substrate-binding protein